jgi:hypothetical protein
MAVCNYTEVRQLDKDWKVPSYASNLTRSHETDSVVSYRFYGVVIVVIHYSTSF